VPRIITLDLEGVLVPEVWIALAEKTGIHELRRTTRDEPDYDKLMTWRLGVLEQHGVRLKDIQDVIATLRPLPGAADFLARLRAREQVIILSDTFYQFATPLMAQLDWPTLFCHELVVDAQDRLTGYRLRIPDGKRRAVESLKALGFVVHSAGDSYNDTTMLGAADRGVLFCCPDSVAEEFPQFLRTRTYDELWEALL
jgi:phosphoserine/homoserine phosphotransferase